MNRYLRIILLGTGAALIVFGSYVLLAKFFRDRQRISIAGLYRARPTAQQHRYTPEQIEQARRTGKPLPGMDRSGQPYVPPQANTAGDAAVQRSLRALEEINRINEMNRRLTDQQQRMQKQN